jgi:S-adenosylmethionine:tRNA ribosyltransferase-isomerase
VRTDDFDYSLPQTSIAQRPAMPRDASRLMVLERETSQVEHAIFRDLPGFLNEGDLLVLNETRVLPARLRVKKLPGGGRAEILLLRSRSASVWEAIVGGKGLRPGVSVELPDQGAAVIREDLGGSRRLVEFDAPIQPRLETIGEMPLPPYIHEPLLSPDEYQTIFARNPGSAAAPTAGLHFTQDLLQELSKSGIGIARVTLHVGLDTFAPVLEEDPRQHALHSEWCSVSAETAEQINQTRQQGGRIIAVGTTSVRTLESAVRARKSGRIEVFQGPTDLFILPGFTFLAIDGLITNFHLPRSTLLMLVSAFTGRERVLSLYRDAIQRGYRFYSFGDAMLIL